MNSNEIVYERKMTGSFMKLRCDEVRPLDEKILLAFCLWRSVM